VLAKEFLYLRRRSPKIFLMLRIEKYVKPRGFDNHFGVVDKFRKHFVLDFALEPVLQVFNEVNHNFA
jgi:hypothetical protein